MATMKDSVTLFSLDLGYLRSGFAVVRQPGDVILKWGLVQAEPYRASKVTDQVRVRRAKSAFDGLRLALHYADQDFGPLDGLVYEKPGWIGGKMRQYGTSKDAMLALGMVLERMYLVLAAVGWMHVAEGGKCRPIYSLDPSRWQPLFTGVKRLPAGQMKAFVKRTLALRMIENEDFEVSRLGDDEIDAIAIGLVAGKLLQIEGTI